MQIQPIECSLQFRLWLFVCSKSNSDRKQQRTASLTRSFHEVVCTDKTSTNTVKTVTLAATRSSLPYLQRSDTVQLHLTSSHSLLPKWTQHTNPCRHIPTRPWKPRSDPYYCQREQIHSLLQPRTSVMLYTASFRVTSRQ